MLAIDEGDAHVTFGDRDRAARRSPSDAEAVVTSSSRVAAFRACPFVKVLEQVTMDGLEAVIGPVVRLGRKALLGTPVGQGPLCRLEQHGVADVDLVHVDIGIVIDDPAIDNPLCAERM